MHKTSDISDEVKSLRTTIEVLRGIGTHALNRAEKAEAENERLRLALLLIKQECEPHTYGKPAYNMTLDNIYDNAVATLTESSDAANRDR